MTVIVISQYISYNNTRVIIISTLSYNRYPDETKSIIPTCMI